MALEMYLKTSFVVIILLLCISTGWGKNDCFAPLSKSPQIPKFELQSFRITVNDSWVGKDKADHFLTSAFLTAGSFYILREEQNMSYRKSINLSIGFAFSLGIAKEIRDGLSQGRAASIKDVVADILGIGIGLFLFNVK